MKKKSTLRCPNDLEANCFNGVNKKERQTKGLSLLWLQYKKGYFIIFLQTYHFRNQKEGCWLKQEMCGLLGGKGCIDIFTQRDILTESYTEYFVMLKFK